MTLSGGAIGRESHQHTLEPFIHAPRSADPRPLRHIGATDIQGHARLTLLAPKASRMSADKVTVTVTVTIELIG